MDHALVDRDFGLRRGGWRFWFVAFVPSVIFLKNKGEGVPDPSPRSANGIDG